MTMANSKNLFAWASISEKGTKNGKKGDQTGKEVKVGDYYNFGQTTCIRFRNVTDGRKCGKIAKQLANDERFGYGHNDRVSSFNAFKKIGWDISKIDDLKSTYNLDCSMFATICINLTFKKEVLPADTFTGNLVTRCRRKKDLFQVLSLTNAKKEWHKGDMPIKENAHVIINV